VLKACLNGGLGRDQHAAVPVTPAELAADAARCRAEGAEAVHVHPRDENGRETLVATAIGAAVTAIRAACPGLPVGVSTGAWIEPNPQARVAAIRSWRVLPDFASVNAHEDGAEAVALALYERGVGVEAGLWTPDAVLAYLAWRLPADAARRDPSRRLPADEAHRDGLPADAACRDRPGQGLPPDAARLDRPGQRSPVDAACRGRPGQRLPCRRLLLETMETDPVAAVANADRMLALLPAAGPPVLLHGEGPVTWAILREARSRGLDVRIGLEDTQVLPDGSPAPDNAALVAAALRILA
jgi:uncharacterized protein (DUF849 family)